MTHAEADGEVRWHEVRAGRAFAAARLLVAECRAQGVRGPDAVYMTGNDQEVAMRWGEGNRKVVFVADAHGHFYVRVGRPVGALHFKSAGDAVTWLGAKKGEGKASG